jgi:excisionase family DNA binding protein
MSIGEASEHLGVSIDTLRRWEKKKRVTPLRSPGGHRYFKKEDLDNLFGKKYTRDEKTKRSKKEDVKNGYSVKKALERLDQEKARVTEITKIPSVKKTSQKEIKIPPIKPIAVKPIIQRVKHTPPPVYQEQKTKENGVAFDTPMIGESRLTRNQKLIITGLSVFVIVDLILFILWYTTPIILSPVP